MRGIVLLAAMLMAQAQVQDLNTGVISGEVRLNDGTPAVKYRVAVVDTLPGGRSVVVSVETDNSGRFKLDRIPPGSYYLRVDSKIYLHPAFYPGVGTTQQAQVVTVTPGKILEGLTLSTSDILPLMGCNEHDGECFDFQRRVVVEGVVKRFQVQNPRLFAVLTVKDELGPRDVDLSGPNAQPFIQKGFGQVKAGDRIKVVLSPRRDGGPGAFLVAFVNPDGTEVRLWGAPASATPSGATAAPPLQTPAGTGPRP